MRILKLWLMVMFMKSKVPTDKYRDNYDKIFRKKEYTYIRYSIPGSITSPEIERALADSMQLTKEKS